MAAVQGKQRTGRQGLGKPRVGQSRGVVAERLRAFRAERGLTLAEVSGRSGVSVSNLSKIERGEVSPSVDLIFRICEGLDLALEQFVKPGPKETINGRKTVTRRGEGIPFSSGQYDYLAHSTELSRKAMVPLEMRVRARSVQAFDHWSQHEGEEYVFVVEGAIEVHTEHYAPFRLDAGESAYFDSGMRHVYVSVGEGDARILSVSHGPAPAATPLAYMQSGAAEVTPAEIAPAEIAPGPRAPDADGAGPGGPKPRQHGRRKSA